VDSFRISFGNFPTLNLILFPEGRNYLISDHFRYHLETFFNRFTYGFGARGSVVG
jgi:hypothetical protein